MKFRKDNKIRYGQDHAYYYGLPSGVDFTVERFKTPGCSGMFKLRADGYGKQPNYGNGPLYVYGLTSRQRARFEKALEEQN